MIRKIAKTLPITYNTLDKLPNFEGWYWCDYYTWSLERNDFISLKRAFFFDGKNFRTQCLSDYDGADWIYDYDRVDWVCDIVSILRKGE